MDIVGALVIAALIISLHIVAYVTCKRTEKNTGYKDKPGFE